MSIDRIKQLMAAGMQFQPTPPNADQQMKINGLAPDEFNQLLALVKKLGGSPQFLSYNNGLQKRPPEET